MPEGPVSIWTAAVQNNFAFFAKKVMRDSSLAWKFDDYGYTPLHYAACHNHIQIVEFILRLGGDPDMNACGATPLHRAAYRGSVQCCQLLLEAGASIHAQDSSFGDMKTPMEKACDANEADVVALLTRYGAVAVDWPRQLPTLTESIVGTDSGGLNTEYANQVTLDPPGRDASSEITITTTVTVDLAPVPVLEMGMRCVRCLQIKLSFSRNYPDALVCSACSLR
jgi:ankyrin repeat protein